MDKMKNPAVVGAGQYGSQPCYAPQLSALASGGRRHATAPCSGAIDEIREKQSIFNISYR